MYNALELKIKPDVVFIIAAVGMWGVSRVTPSFDIPLFYRVAVGVLVGLIGFCIIQIAGSSFRRASTTINPAKPSATSSLITTGLFGVTRNPIYIGMACILLGWSIILSSIAAPSLIIVFMAYIWRFQVIPEERALHALFGDKYVSYRARVRRWL